MLKLVCQIYSIPVIILPAWNTGGKADFLVISFLISFTSSKDMARALQQKKGKRKCYLIRETNKQKGWNKGKRRERTSWNRHRFPKGTEKSKMISGLVLQFTLKVNLFHVLNWTSWHLSISSGELLGLHKSLKILKTSSHLPLSVGLFRDWYVML